MGVGETLMPDIVVPEPHQNDRSYVHEFSGPTFDSLRKNLAWWAGTQRTSKNPTKQSKLECGCLHGEGCLPRTIQYLVHIVSQPFVAINSTSLDMFSTLDVLFH